MYVQSDKLVKTPLMHYFILPSSLLEDDASKKTSQAVTPGDFNTPELSICNNEKVHNCVKFLYNLSFLLIYL